MILAHGDYYLCPKSTELRKIAATIGLLARWASSGVSWNLRCRNVTFPLITAKSNGSRQVACTVRCFGNGPLKTSVVTHSFRRKRSARLVELDRNGLDARRHRARDCPLP